MDAATPRPTLETFPLNTKPLQGLVAMTRLLINREDTRQFFLVFDAIDGPQTERNFERFRSTPTGAKLIAERFDLKDLLCDRAALAAMPPGSLGAEYFRFTETEQIDAGGLLEAEVGADIQLLRVEGARRRFWSTGIVLHDVWHVLTGYGRDALGEAGVVTFTYGQLKTRGIGMFAILLGLREKFFFPSVPVIKCLAESLRLAREAKWLIAEDWRRLLAMPLDEVRRELNIGTPVVYKAHAAKTQAADQKRREKLARAATV